jgi:hypothetical protein
MSSPIPSAPERSGTHGHERWYEAEVKSGPHQGSTLPVPDPWDERFALLELPVINSNRFQRYITGADMHDVWPLYAVARYRLTRMVLNGQVTYYYRHFETNHIVDASQLGGDPLSDWRMQSATGKTERRLSPGRSG